MNLKDDVCSLWTLIFYRYTDFIVNEVLLSGEVVHLNDYNVPSGFMRKQKQEPSRKEDRQLTAIAKSNYRRPLSTLKSTIDSADPQSKGTINELQTPPEILESPIHMDNDSIGQPPNDPQANNSQQNMTMPSDSANPSKQSDEATMVESVCETSLEIPTEREAALKEIFGDKAFAQMMDLAKRINRSPGQKSEAHGFVRTGPILDKSLRGKGHNEIRKAFGNHVDSKTDISDNTIVVSAVGPMLQSKFREARASRKPPKLSLRELGGEYLHFTLCKEYKDTNEVLSYLSYQTRAKNSKIFDVAGNKDKRAVTTQRISAYHLRAEQLLGLNKSLRNARVGNCSYQPQRIKMAQNRGNEFVITLRDCEFRSPLGNIVLKDEAAARGFVRTAMDDFQASGFVNYYGRQRFGSYASARTDITGIALLKEDYQGVVEKILDYSPDALGAAKGDPVIEGVSQDDKKRALAIDLYRQSPNDLENVTAALKIMPKKYASECAILRAFAKGAKARGAIENIPRNARSLYGHAYQSYIWNVVASHRWSQHGRAVMTGDLVLVKEHRDKEAPSEDLIEDIPDVDADGEAIIEPTGDDRATTAEDEYLGARALTEEEAASGRYSIFDIVLPLPGHDVLYPEYLLPLYESTMKTHGGLDPRGMRRSWRDISLPGSYRKLLERLFGTIGFEVVSYADEDVDIAVTDLHKLERKANGLEVVDKIGDAGIEIHQGIETGPRMAVVLKFQLGSGIYATMALRELMKPGPIEWKPEFSNGRD